MPGCWRQLFPLTASGPQHCVSQKWWCTLPLPGWQLKSGQANLAGPNLPTRSEGLIEKCCIRTITASSKPTCCLPCSLTRAPRWHSALLSAACQLASGKAAKIPSQSPGTSAMAARLQTPIPLAYLNPDMRRCGRGVPPGIRVS